MQSVEKQTELALTYIDIEHVSKLFAQLEYKGKKKDGKERCTTRLERVGHHKTERTGERELEIVRRGETRHKETDSQWQRETGKAEGRNKSDRLPACD